MNHNLEGNAETSVVSINNLIDTYGRVSSVSISSLNEPPALNWGGPTINTGTCDMPEVEAAVVNTAWNIAYRALATENIVARLKLQNLNPERRYTVKAYASFKNQSSAPPSARIKANGIYSNIVALFGNKSSFMVLEDCVPSNDGTLLIDCLPMRESISTAVPFNFFVIEEYRSSSDPENKDVFLRKVTVVEDNETGSVTTPDIHLHLNCVGSATHYRIAETSDALQAAQWKPVPEDMNVPFTLSDGFGEKTIVAQVKNTYTESNVRAITIEYKDPYVALVLKAIYINDNDASTTNASVCITIERDGMPTHYRVGETADLSAMEWKEWAAGNNAQIAYTLSAGAGQKTVYVQLKDLIVESAVRVDVITLVVLDYAQVMLDIDIASAPDKSALSIVFAPLKYNKKFAYGITSDDTHVSAWNVLFKYFNGMWMDDLNYFHKYDVNGNLNQRTTGAYAPRALTYTDGCGTIRRFEVNTANFYNLTQRYLENKGGTQFPYLLWAEVEEMLEFDGAISLHDVKDPSFETNGGTVENIVLGINDSNRLIKERIGRKCMVMTEPNGDAKYTTAAELVAGIRMITRQQALHLGYDWADLTSDKLNVDKLKVARLFNEKPVNGAETWKQEFLSAYNNKEGWYGEFGCHGTDKNKAVDESAKGWPHVKTFFDWLCDTYGQPGDDTIWFATNEEVIQYKALCEMSVIGHTIEGNIMHVTLNVPVLEDFNWSELTLLVSGLPSGNVSESSNVKGLSYGFKNEKFMINVNLDSTLEARANKYVGKFESSYQVDDKTAAEYFIQRLKPSLRMEYQSRIEAATQPPALYEFDVLSTTEQGTDTPNVTFYYATNNRATQYMVSESSVFEGAEWIKVGMPNVPFVLKNVAGDHTVYFKVKNQFGESAVRSDTITYVPVALDLISVTVNQGAATTSNSVVAVGFVCVGSPTHYMVSENATFTGTDWVRCSAGEIQYALSSGFGNKTVYLKLKDVHTQTVAKSDQIERVEQEPVKTIVSLAGTAKVVSNPTVNEKVVNVISVSKHESFPNLQLKDSLGNNTGFVLCKPSLYPAGIPGTIDNIFAPSLDDLGTYPALYLSRYVTSSSVTNVNSPILLRFGSFAPGIYTVRILSSGSNGASISADKWGNVFYSANLEQSNLTYDVVNNKDQFVEIENTVVKEDGILDIKAWLTISMNYRPGLNLIEIIKK